MAAARPEMAGQATGRPDKAGQATGRPDKAGEGTGQPDKAGQATGRPDKAGEGTGQPDKARHEVAGRRRTRLNAAQRRESILAAAVEVFSAAGYRAGKVSDVAALVGVSEPVIFQNFGSKAALFAAVVDRVAGHVQAELDRLAAQPGSAAGLLAHALEPGHRHGHQDGPHAHGFGAHGVLFSDAFALIGEPELTEAARRAARTIAGHLADLIRRGQADGDIRAGLDPEPAAWLLLSILSTRSFRAVVAPGSGRIEDGVTTLALRLLSPGD